MVWIDSGRVFPLNMSFSYGFLFFSSFSCFLFSSFFSSSIHLRINTILLPALSDSVSLLILFNVLVSLFINSFHNSFHNSLYTTHPSFKSSPSLTQSRPQHDSQFSTHTTACGFPAGSTGTKNQSTVTSRNTPMPLSTASDLPAPMAAAAAPVSRPVCVLSVSSRTRPVRLMPRLTPRLAAL